MISAESLSGKAELAQALVKVQAALEGAKKSKKNDHFRSKYADLAAVWDACREPLTENGLSVIQAPCEAPSGHVGLASFLLHVSGQCVGDKFFMPIKDPTNPQAVGSALTYARRYALSALIGICPEDDDGNAAAAPASKPKESVIKATFTPDPNIAYKVKAAYQNDFAYAKGLGNQDGMKAVFTELRNSTLPEPDKTQLLTEFSNQIKQMGK